MTIGIQVRPVVLSFILTASFCAKWDLMCDPDKSTKSVAECTNMNFSGSDDSNAWYYIQAWSRKCVCCASCFMCSC